MISATFVRSHEEQALLESLAFNVRMLANRGRLQHAGVLEVASIQPALCEGAQEGRP